MWSRSHGRRGKGWYRRDRGVRRRGEGGRFGDLASSCRPRRCVSLEGWIRGGQGGVGLR